MAGTRLALLRCRTVRIADGESDPQQKPDDRSISLLPCRHRVGREHNAVEISQCDVVGRCRWSTPAEREGGGTHDDEENHGSAATPDGRECHDRHCQHVQGEQTAKVVTAECSISRINAIPAARQ